MSSRIAVIARESIQVQSRLAIPLDEIGFRYSRSSGPGGQHAQKTETRVEALFDVDASETLSDAQKARLQKRVGPVVRAVAQDERSRTLNRELALDRLAAAIRAGLRVERKRRPTKPSAAARERRLEEKKRRGTAKKLRRPPADE
jgi:ribosome-associated protein